MSLIAHDIVRVRFSPREFRPRRSWDVAAPDDVFEAPEFALEDGELINLLSGELAVSLDQERGTLSFKHQTLGCFAEDFEGPE